MRSSREPQIRRGGAGVRGPPWARDHLLDDDGAVFAFYDRRVDSAVQVAAPLRPMVEAARLKRPDLLLLTMDVLADRCFDGRDYPDTWRQDDLVLPVTCTCSSPASLETA